MEENEDEPEDVRRASPVEDEIVKGEKDEKAKDEGPIVKKRAKARCDKSLKKRSKATGNTKKSDADCCLGRRGESSKTPRTTTVLVFEKPCSLPKLEIIPRHCLSRKEHIDHLATPSRKCPSPCLRKPVVRNIRPISARINELSLPTRQRITATLQERGFTLPPELVDNLIKILEGEACMTPEQASRYFRDKRKCGSKKQKKDPRYKCKEKSKKKRSQRMNSLGLDEEAVKCQYLMAERFVKSILEWKCSIPKEEFKDIADVILRRLSYTLNYTPVQEEDRKSQQMRLLADMVASWISGVLFEVAEVHKKELEEECEKRRREKEMETDESEEEEEDDEDEDEEEAEEEEEEEEEEMITEEKEEKKKPKKDKKKPKEQKKKGKEGKEMVDKPRKEKSAEIEIRETEDKKRDEEESREKGEEVVEISGGEETEVSEATKETEEESKKTPDEEVAVDETRRPEEEQRIEAEKEEEAEKKRKEEEESKAAEAAEAEQRKKAEEEDAEKQRKQREEEAELQKQQEEAEKKKQEEWEEEKRKEEAAEAERKLEEEELQRRKQEEDEAEKKKQEREKEEEEEAEKKRQEEEAEAERKKEEEELEKKKQEEAEQQKKREEELAQQGKEDEQEADRKKREEERLIAQEKTRKASKEKEEKMKKEMEEKLKDGPQPALASTDDVTKVFKAELPFVTFGRILDVVNKILQEETQSSGDDPLANRIKYAIYEKFTNLIKSEDPKLLTENMKDVVNILAGKLSSWLAATLTDSQMHFVEKHPAEVESVEIRDWSSWIDSTTCTADQWISWIRKTIREAQTMQDKKVTRSEWHSWTKSVETNALLWRRYYLQTLHQADRNVTALRGRNIVKTGQKGKLDHREMEIKTINLEAD